MARRKKMVDRAIDVVTLGDNTIVAAPGVGKSIRVHNYAMVAGGSVTARWKSGANNKSGAIPMAANTGLSFGGGDPDQGARAFTCNDNEALILNLSAAIQVSGHLTYSVIPTALADLL